MSLKPFQLLKIKWNCWSNFAFYTTHTCQNNILEHPPRNTCHTVSVFLFFQHIEPPIKRFYYPFALFPTFHFYKKNNVGWGGGGLWFNDLLLPGSQVLCWGRWWSCLSCSRISSLQHWNKSVWKISHFPAQNSEIKTAQTCSAQTSSLPHIILLSFKWDAGGSRLQFPYHCLGFWS